jgi:hypothetical protein
MKARCDSSTDENNSELGKRSSLEDFHDFFFGEPKELDFPGYDCAYLFSVNYQNVDRLVARFGHSLAAPEVELDQERKLICSAMKSGYNKTGLGTPCSGRIASARRPDAAPKKKQTPKKKHHMNLRDKYPVEGNRDFRDYHN